MYRNQSNPCLASLDPIPIPYGRHHRHFPWVHHHLSPGLPDAHRKTCRIFFPRQLQDTGPRHLNYSESDYESDQSTSNSSTDFDSRNLSKEEAFQILEVMETSTRQEIKNSRNRLINQWHPDKHRTPLYRETAEKNTKLIISAYELLRELGYAD